MGLYVRTKVDGLDKLKERIEFVKKMALLNTNTDFQKYIQSKFLETVNEISMQRLPEGDMKQEYISHNQIRELDDGFVLFNDTTVATVGGGGYGGKFIGTFSIALAFEYGTGIVGQENPKQGAWEYNINNHENGWYYFKNGSFHFTRGMEGQEIYRFTLEKIKEQLPNWIREYQTGGVSK